MRPLPTRIAHRIEGRALTLETARPIAGGGQPPPRPVRPDDRVPLRVPPAHRPGRARRDRRARVPGHLGPDAARLRVHAHHGGERGPCGERGAVPQAVRPREPALPRRVLREVGGNPPFRRPYSPTRPTASGCCASRGPSRGEAGPPGEWSRGRESTCGRSSRFSTGSAVTPSWACPPRAPAGRDDGGGIGPLGADGRRRPRHPGQGAELPARPLRRGTVGTAPPGRGPTGTRPRRTGNAAPAHRRGGRAPPACRDGRRARTLWASGVFERRLRHSPGGERLRPSRRASRSSGEAPWTRRSRSPSSTWRAPRR
jgi:hypothetical protein